MTLALSRVTIDQYSNSTFIMVKKTISISLLLLCFTNLFSSAPVANFTLPGENNKEIWSENFDIGFEGWTIKSTNTSQDYNWRHETSLTGNKSFTSIDATNLASMFITGINAPRYGSQEEWLISPTIVSIANNSSLSLYLGYSKAYFSSGNNYKIFVTDASLDEPNWIQLWDAATQTVGESPFAFRKLRLDLSSFGGKDIKFAIVYYVDSQAKYASGGDLVVDGLEIYSPADNNSIDIFAGDSIQFFDLSENSPTQWEWTFEGGTPAESNLKNPTIQYTVEGVYPVTLKVSNSEGSNILTKTNMVHVENRSPIARICAPSGFRNHNGSRAYFVPAKENIQFSDLSKNYPSSWNWTFDGGIVKSSTSAESPTIYYDSPGIYTASLSVENSKGQSADAIILEAGYQTVISNMQYGEKYTSFQTDENEYFPGNNSRIEAYAEYYEKPAIPILLDSVEIAFVNAHMDEQDIMSRIKTIRVRIYKAENYQPVGKELAWGILETLQAEYDRGRPSGVYFGSDLPLVIDFPFMIVVEEIPFSKEYSLNMTMGMAPWRDNGNSAFLRKKNDDKFIAVDKYFGEGKQTSLGITPHITYLVLQPETEELVLPKNAQTARIKITSTASWIATIQEEENWCQIQSTVNNQIDGILNLQIDANTSDTERQSTIQIYNGFRTKEITIKQEADLNSNTKTLNEEAISVYFNSGNKHLYISNSAAFDILTIYTLDGKRMLNANIQEAHQHSIYLPQLKSGMYILQLKGVNKNYNTKIIIN